MTTTKKAVIKHITDERLLGFMSGRVDLTDDEQEHIRNCEFAMIAFGRS